MSKNRYVKLAIHQTICYTAPGSRKQRHSDSSGGMYALSQPAEVKWLCYICVTVTILTAVGDQRS